jgi:hypothetical protein
VVYLPIAPHFYGILAAALQGLFILTFVLLGFIHPGYDHKNHSVSELVGGKLGWIQSLNFVLFAVSLTLTGLGLGQTVHGNLLNPISLTFSLFALGAILTAATPVHKLPTAHYIVVFTCFILAHFAVISLVKIFVPIPSLAPLIPYTFLVLITNSLSGFLWFIFYKTRASFASKGLFQKAIIVNAMTWLIVLNLKL